MDDKMKVLRNQILFRKNLPLDIKVKYSLARIRTFENLTKGDMYVSYSGGKDSVVLLDLVRKQYPNTKGVFCNTGLEFPEIVKFVRETKNILWLKPKISFKEVINKYGYPVISKETAQNLSEYRSTKSKKLKDKRFNQIPHKWKRFIDAPFKISEKCCKYLKKDPFRLFEKESGLSPILGMMVTESRLREQKYYKDGGCLYFDNETTKRNMLNPLSFWTEEDVWEYIKLNKLNYCDIYNDCRINRTGCTFCLFGYQYSSNKDKFEYIKEKHPRLWEYINNELGFEKVFNFIEYDPQLTLF